MEREYSGYKSEKQPAKAYFSQLGGMPAWVEILNHFNNMNLAMTSGRSFQTRF